MLNNKNKIYFAGSIKGGKGDVKKYMKIINYLKKYGEVLTEHVGNVDKDIGSDKKIYQRDMQWLNSANIIVAEVSTPSLGVGYEIAQAENLDKNILCLYCNKANKNLSSMIAGNKKINVKKYNKYEDIFKIIDAFFAEY
jgi:hypothetical protein